MKRSFPGKESWTVSAVAKKKPKDSSDSAANGNLKPAKIKPGPASWKTKKMDQLARAEFADIDDLLMTDSDDDEDEEEVESKDENEEEEVEDEGEEEEDCFSDIETADLGTSNIFEIEMKNDERKGVVKYIVDVIVGKAWESINSDSSHKTLKAKSKGESLTGKKAAPVKAECDICGQTVSLARLTVHKRLPHSFHCTKVSCDKKFTIAKALERHMRSSHDKNEESEEEEIETPMKETKKTLGNNVSHDASSTPEPDSSQSDKNGISPDPDIVMPDSILETVMPDPNIDTVTVTPDPDIASPEPESSVSPEPNSSSRTASRKSSVDSNESCKFVCKYCAEEFNTEGRLMYHYYSPHLFQCENCEMSFNTRITMENHVSVMHNQAGILGLDSSCHLCGETFKRSSTLERHKSSPHTFACKFCVKRFPFKKQLTKHNSTFHKGQKLPKPPKKERKKKVVKKEETDDEEEEVKEEGELDLEDDRAVTGKMKNKDMEDNIEDETKENNTDDGESEEDDEEITQMRRGRKRKVAEESSDDNEEEEIERPIRRQKRILSDDDEASEEEEEEMKNGNDEDEENILNASSDRVETPDDAEETEIEPPVLKGKAKKELEDITEELTCELCDLTIMGKKKFNVHKKKIHKFPCDVDGCEKKFVFKGKLAQHIKSAHAEAEDIYDCEKCGVRVCDAKTKPEIAAVKVDRHNALPHEHECQACDLKFVSEERRDFHSSKVHDTEFTSELVCKMCRRAFESEKMGKNNALVIRNFLIHLESLHEFKCDECEQAFTTKLFLKKHEEDEHSESLAKQQCSMCGMEVLKDEKENAKVKLKSHESQSHPHDCEECDFHFTSDLRLKHHENIAHDKENKIDLSCTLCGKDFEEMNQLFDHSETPHGFPCKFCEKEFTKKGLLTFHVNSNHKKDDEEEVFSCDLCDDEFLKKEQLDAHVKSAHKEPLICVKCKEDFGEDTSAFEDHINTNHAFTCEECDVSYAESEKLKKHKKKEHPKLCTLCDKDFEDSLDEFEEHKTFKHEFDCNRCPLKFVTKSLQEAHSFDAHGVEDEEDTQCGICQLNFKVSKFRDHLRAPHRWPCDHCRLKFAEKVSLDEHVTDAHDIFLGKKKVYTCKFCEDEFKDKEKYKEHKNVKHKYDCSKCELKFTSSSKLEEHSLEEHKQKKSKNLKKLTCNFCGLVCDKKFDMPSCKDYYLKHVATPHKFSCKRCDFRFTVKGKLDKHMIEVHTGESSGFECKLCGYYFSHKKLFDDHETKTHRYKCRDHNCPNKFISEDQLEKHCMKKHQDLVAQPVRKERDYNCNLCGRVFKSDSRLESHLTIKHEFGCKYCPRRYTVDVALSEHIKTVHKIEDRRERERKGVKAEPPKRSKNAFVCSKCRQEKRTIQEYRQHIQMSHSYTCNYCHLKFTMKSYLDVHMECTHMEAVVMGMLATSNAEQPSQQDAAANRRLARQSENALTWLRSKIVRDHLLRVMAGKGHSARHRMFMDTSIREECCRTDQSKLFKLSHQSFLSLPPSCDATVLSVMEQIYVSGPPVLKDVPRSKFMFEYITCVLLPDAWLLFLIKTKGLNQQDAEAAFFKGGSEVEQRKLFDLDVKGWLEKEEIKNWAKNSVPQEYKPRDEKQGYPGAEAPTTKPDIERRLSSSTDNRSTPIQPPAKVTPNKPQYTSDRTVERADSWERGTTPVMPDIRGTTPVKPDIRSPYDGRSTPTNPIRERRDSSSSSGRMTPNKPIDPRHTPNKPTDPRHSSNKPTDPRHTPNKPTDPRHSTNKLTDPRHTPNKAMDPRQTPNKPTDPRQRSHKSDHREDPRRQHSGSMSYQGNQKTDVRDDPRKMKEDQSKKDASVPTATKSLEDYGLSQESLAWLGLSTGKQVSSDSGKFTVPDSQNVDKKSSQNNARDSYARDPRSNSQISPSIPGRDPQRSPSIPYEKKPDFGGAFRDPRSQGKPDKKDAFGSSFRDPRRPESHQEKKNDFGDGFRDRRKLENVNQQKKSDFGSAFRDPRSTGEANQEKKNDFGSAFKKAGNPNHEKGSDFGSAFRDHKRSESNSNNRDQKNDFGGGFKDFKRSESYNQDKKSDFGGGFRDFKRSESHNQDKKNDFGGAFKDLKRSESHGQDNKNDFGGSFRDAKRAESHGQEKKSDFGGAFRDARRLESPSQQKKNDGATKDPRRSESHTQEKSHLGNINRDPRSQVKVDKKPGFVSTFKETTSEKQTTVNEGTPQQQPDTSSRDPRRLIKPTEDKNDTRDPRKKESKETRNFYENYY